MRPARLFQLPTAVLEAQAPPAEAAGAFPRTARRSARGPGAVPRRRGAHRAAEGLGSVALVCARRAGGCTDDRARAPHAPTSAAPDGWVSGAASKHPRRVTARADSGACAPGRTCNRCHVPAALPALLQSTCHSVRWRFCQPDSASVQRQPDAPSVKLTHLQST